MKDITPQQYLEQIRKRVQQMNRAITRKWEMIDYLYEKVMKTTKALHDIIVQQSPELQANQKHIAWIQDLKGESISIEVRIADMTYEARKLLKKLSDPRMAQVLELHYLQGKSLNAVAERLGYSRNHVCNLLRQGLSEFQVPEDSFLREMPFRMDPYPD